MWNEQEMPQLLQNQGIQSPKRASLAAGTLEWDHLIQNLILSPVPTHQHHPDFFFLIFGKKNSRSYVM